MTAVRAALALGLLIALLSVQPSWQVRLRFVALHLLIR